MQKGTCLLKNKSYKFILRFILALTIPIALYFVPVDYFDSGETICIVKNIAGYECPGCGMIRALFHTIHFEYSAAFQDNKGVFIVFLLLAFNWGQIVFESLMKILLETQNHFQKRGLN